MIRAGGIGVRPRRAYRGRSKHVIFFSFKVTQEMWQNVNFFKSLDNMKFGYIPLFFYMFEIFHNKNESGGDHKK